jgi:hypothetical protein
MVSGRRRFRCDSGRIVVWTEPDSLAVRLRDRADWEQQTARHDGDDQFHDLFPSFFSASADSKAS